MQSISPDPDNFLLLELPAKVKYALLALLELVTSFSDQKFITIPDIVAKQPIPERYLEQILMSLKRNGIVKSYRGMKGGYILTRSPWQITVLDVFIAIEGEKKTQFSTSTASNDRIMLSDIWQEAQNAMWQILQKQTLDDLYRRCEAFHQDSVMYHI